MTNTVTLKRSNVANSVPAAGNLVAGELAINYTDGNLFYKNNSNVVTVIASNKFVSVSGNVTGGNAVISGIVTAAGNVIGGNIRTTGVITATGNITGNYFIGNGSQLTNVTATSVQATVTAAQGNTNLVYADVADNDYFRIMVGGTSDSGFVEIATADNSDEPIYVRQYNFVGGNSFGSIARTLTLLDANGNTLVPQMLSAAGNVIGGNLLTSGLVSASGTITGTSHIGSVVSVTANVTGGNVLTGGIVTAVGNVIGGNIRTAGLITATGNITGGNILTAGVVSAASTITGTSLTGSVISVTANVTGGNVLTGGLISASANITGGNVLTAGQVSATGNITGSYIVGNGYYLTGISTGSGIDPLSGTVDTFTGNGTQTNFTLSTTPVSNTLIFVNVNGVYQLPAAYSLAANVLTMTSAVPNGATLAVTQLSGGGIGNSLVNGTSNIVVGSSSNVSVSVGGTSNVAVFATSGLFMTGNITPSANITYDLGTSTQRWKDLWLSNSTIYLGNAQISANATAVTITNPAGGTTVLAGAAGSSSLTGAVVSATGNITGGNILTGGEVSATGNITGNYILGNGALLTGVITSVANINNGTSNVTVVTSDGNITVGVGGTSNVAVFATTGEYVTGVISASGNIISAANVSGGNILTGGLISAAGAITLNSGSAATAIINGAGNGVGNIGSSTTYFNTVFAKATSAQYADLAEMYVADAKYEPGTVVSFGGEQEITISNIDNDFRVAGVVSTNPSYLMNSAQQGKHVVAVAMTGRVPCKVTGKVFKGDLMVTAGNGHAKTNNLAITGTVIGKALENYNGESGVIEVVVGTR